VTTVPTTGAPVSVAAAATPGSSGRSLGQDAFLSLLVTQLQHQDPTQPQDDAQFIAQLAQFSSLEQMQQMNQTLSMIVAALTPATTAPATIAPATTKPTTGQA